MIALNAAGRNRFRLKRENPALAQCIHKGPQHCPGFAVDHGTTCCRSGGRRRSPCTGDPVDVLARGSIEQMHSIPRHGEQPLPGLPQRNASRFAGPFSGWCRGYQPGGTIDGCVGRHGCLSFNRTVKQPVDHRQGFVDECFLLRLPGKKQRKRQAWTCAFENDGIAHA